MFDSSVLRNILPRIYSLGEYNCSFQPRIINKAENCARHESSDSSLIQCQTELQHFISFAAVLTAEWRGQYNNGTFRTQNKSLTFRKQMNMVSGVRGVVKSVGKRSFLSIWLS